MTRESIMEGTSRTGVFKVAQTFQLGAKGDGIPRLAGRGKSVVG